MTLPQPAIRKATREDAAELARLISPLGYVISQADVEAVWDAWTREGNFALVVEGTDCLLGVVTVHRMVVLHRPMPVGRITSLVVDPAVRGNGYGRALIRAAEVALTKAGCGLVEITSHVRRLEAHRFYEHFGYVRTSHRFAKDLTVSGQAGLEPPNEGGGISA